MDTFIDVMLDLGIIILLAYPLYLMVLAIRYPLARRMGMAWKFPRLSPAIYLASILALALAAILLADSRPEKSVPAGDIKKDLEALRTMQALYFAEHGAYAGQASQAAPPGFADLGFEPRTETMAFICGEAFLPARSPDFDTIEAPPGLESIESGADSSGFTCLAYGNFDRDDYLEVWSVNDQALVRRLQSDWGDRDLAGDPEMGSGLSALPAKSAALLLALGFAPLPLLVIASVLDERRWRRTKRVFMENFDNMIREAFIARTASGGDAAGKSGEPQPKRK